MAEKPSTHHRSGSLRGQHIVIIGGRSGREYAAAECALAEGAQVTIASNGGRIPTALARLGSGASGAHIDVRDEAGVAGFFGEMAPFDHLIYLVVDSGPRLLSASLRRRDPIAAAHALRMRDWSALMAIQYAQLRLSPGGSIVLTDRFPTHRPPWQSAQPSVFEHMIGSLAVDLAPIRVNAVRSGLRSQGRQHRCIPRSAEPVEIAQAYLYLLRGTYTTGKVLVVDGGLTLS